jgi:hypothetical protein
VFNNQVKKIQKVSHSQCMMKVSSPIQLFSFPFHPLAVFSSELHCLPVFLFFLLKQLRGLGETAPPQLNAELCKRLSQHISDLLASVSEVADRAVAFLKRHEQELHDQVFE